VRPVVPWGLLHLNKSPLDAKQISFLEGAFLKRAYLTCISVHSWAFPGVENHPKPDHMSMGLHNPNKISIQSNQCGWPVNEEIKDHHFDAQRHSLRTQTGVAERMTRFLMSTAHPNSSLEGNRQPMNMSADSISVCVSHSNSGEMVTWLIPYSSKQCCRDCSIFPHCSNEVPRGTQTWREPSMTLLF
jgi:hypothetical protein